MVTVSVIIPTYNRTELLRQAINSVLGQTYQDLEIIIVDDASSANIKDVVASFRDKRIKYIRHETNRGSSAARNTGITTAQGDYIAFLDDDDEWRKDKLEKQLAAIRNEGYDAVLCGALVNNRFIRRHNGNRISAKDLKKGNYFDPSGLLARVAVLKEILFDESLRIGEDWDVFIRIAKKYKLGFVNEPLLIYSDAGHMRVTNEAVNLPIDKLQERMPVLEKHKEFLGPYWLNYHKARFLLSYIGQRDDKRQQILSTIRICGLFAVLSVLFLKFYQYVRRT